MQITSTSNPRIKQIRKLRERKEREQSGLFFIEGLKIVGEAIQTEAAVECLLVAPDVLSSDFGNELVIASQKKGIELIELNPAVFAHLALKENPQGIAAVLRQRWNQLTEIDLHADGIWIALDEIADPGNLGTILRTSDSVGAKGVILLDHCTDPYDPTSIRASMGAIFSQKLVRCSFEQFIQWEKAMDFLLVGTSDRSSDDYQSLKYPARLILLMGSERQGLPFNHIQLCDEMVSIPMVGRSDSLNLAVATAVVLYEVHNQHRRLPQGASQK